MKVREVIQTIIIYLEQKGVNSDEQVLRRLELLDKFNTVRAKFISDMMIKSEKGVPTQISNQNYNTTFQDKQVFSGRLKASYFDLLDTVMGRISYVGSADGVCRFNEFLTIGEFQSTVKNQIPDEIGYLRYNGMLAVDSQSVTEVMTTAVFVNPYKLPTFNPNYDQYPIDEALIPQLCEALYQTYFAKIAQIKPDVTPDSTQL